VPVVVDDDVSSRDDARPQRFEARADRLVPISIDVDERDRPAGIRRKGVLEPTFDKMDSVLAQATLVEQEMADVLEGSNALPDWLEPSIASVVSEPNRRCPIPKRRLGKADERVEEPDVSAHRSGRGLGSEERCDAAARDATLGQGPRDSFLVKALDEAKDADPAEAVRHSVAIRHLEEPAPFGIPR